MDRETLKQIGQMRPVTKEKGVGCRRQRNRYHPVSARSLRSGFKNGDLVNRPPTGRNYRAGPEVNICCQADGTPCVTPR